MCNGTGEQPAPVSATEPERRTHDPVGALISLPCYVCGKEERERPMTLSDKWRHEDPNDCIGTLRARLAKAERERDDVIACARGASMDDAAIHSMRKYIAEKIKIEDERNDLAVRLAEAERVTEEQVLAMRVIGMTDAESLTCISQSDGMLVVSAVDDDGKTYALDLQSLFKALTAARGGG